MSKKKKPVSEKATEPSESTTPVSAPATDSVATPAAEPAAVPATDAAAPFATDETPKPETSEPVSKIVPTAGSYPFVQNPAPVDGLTPHVRAVAEMGLGDVNPFD